MPGGRHSASSLLLLAVALAGLGAWFLLGDDETERDRALDASPAGATKGSPAPGLIGATGLPKRPAEGVEVRAKPEVEASAASASAPRAGRRPLRRTQSVRVLDATGRPIHRAEVRLRLQTAGGVRPFSASTGRDGRASVRLPPGLVLAVTVIWRGKRLHSIEDGRGIDVSRIGDVRSEDLYLLNVRTVDDAGVPRPSQRVLFRPLVEGVQPTGWGGSTSDAEGWCRLGPYALGDRLEIRAGPRGLTRAERADPSAWQAVEVDGGEVELVVGEAPRLRLAFPGAPSGTRLTITLLNLDTGARLFPPVHFDAGGGIWTAEALTEDVPLEVVILDARKGLFARLRDIVPIGRPQDVRLERGKPITGRVVSPDVPALESGVLSVVGRGFQAITPVGPRGRFKFAGLPDVSFAIHARVKADVDGAPWYVGQARRTQETDLHIPVGRAVSVVGILRADRVEAAVSPFTVEATSPDWHGTRSVSTYRDSLFTLELPAGRWRLTARGASTSGATLEALSDLRLLNADRKDVVLHLLQVGR